MVDKDVIELSKYLMAKSRIESNYHPIDRFFLEPYIGSILAVDTKQFLFYNLESVNNTYSIQLMLCLPELWDDILLDDLLSLCEQFTNDFSFYAIILFSYRYIEIDIIKSILSLDYLKYETKYNIRSYLRNQYNNLLKTEEDFFILTENVIGVNIGDWLYLKQKFLVDQRVEPALSSISLLKKYVESI